MLVCSVILVACGNAPQDDKWKKAQSMYEAHCKNDANGKIYRKVEGVEGILLLKVRPQQRYAMARYKLPRCRFC
jgi:hypothetical protein